MLAFRLFTCSGHLSLLLCPVPSFSVALPPFIRRYGFFLPVIHKHRYQARIAQHRADSKRLSDERHVRGAQFRLGRHHAVAMCVGPWVAVMTCDQPREDDQPGWGEPDLAAVAVLYFPINGHVVRIGISNQLEGTAHGAVLTSCAMRPGLQTEFSHPQPVVSCSSPVSAHFYFVFFARI